MNISKKEKILLFLAVISLILLVIVFRWINYLSSNDYIYYNSQYDREGFGNSYINDGFMKTSTTVNLPLNTTYSCKNMCGPSGRCYITGQQCLADIDCPGCEPRDSFSKSKSSQNVPGDNDSGKLTVGVTPRYSSLTTDIGTKSAIFNNNKFGRPPQLNSKVNTWREKYNTSTMLYNSKFKPPQMSFMPNYRSQYSVTGEFIDNGPLPSNWFVTNV
jgi:hypothetical protein